MNNRDIGVCTWSIDRFDVIRGIELTSGSLDLHVAQIGFFTEEVVERADPQVIVETAKKVGVRLIGSFVAFEREDYSSIGRIAETGGFTSDEHYADRLAITVRAAEITEAIGCRSLAVHAGTIPADRGSSVYAKLVERVAEVTDALAELNGMHLLLETGRESAEVLLGFLDSVNRSNIGVNFDPANFLAFGADEPVRALSILADRVENVHMKDATRSERPGVEYGKPAALGSGDADIPLLLEELERIDYTGPLLIECSGTDNIEAVRRAADYLKALPTVMQNGDPGPVSSG
ncbi:MAG: sugar phosphate isomerase/epimerase [Phycisphaerales bacterium]|nr:MAG: sugar phosphate isomerase/epimerase [Phycisphaerales bacterium]